MEPSGLRTGTIGEALFEYDTSSYVPKFTNLSSSDSTFSRIANGTGLALRNTGVESSFRSILI